MSAQTGINAVKLAAVGCTSILAMTSAPSAAQVVCATDLAGELNCDAPTPAPPTPPSGTINLNALVQPVVVALPPNFESTVINPFTQLAFTLGSMETNMSFAYRLEAPIFDFQKTQPADLLEQEQTIIHNFVFQGKLGIWDRLSLYCQIVFRNTALVEEQPYEVMPFDGFLGLSYAFGKFGEDEQPKTPTKD